MDQFITRIGDGGEVVAAAVASIVLTVLATISTVLRVHADQTEWAEMSSTAEMGPVDHGDVGNGGGSTWV
jgi:hypothetical protein